MSQYRPAAVQAAVASGSHDDHLEVMRPLTWVAGIAMVALLLLGLGWSSFVNVPITVASRGILIAPEGVIDIVSDTTGILGDLTVKVNERVTPGMVLAHVEQPDVRLELSAAEGTLKDAQSFLDRIQADQQREQRALDEFRKGRDAALTENIRLLETQRTAVSGRIQALRNLSNQQIVTQDRVLSVNAEFISLEAQIAQANRERNQLALDEETNRIQRERDELEAARRVSEATRAVANIRLRLDRLGVVRALYGGRIVELKANGGDAVQRGTPIMLVERHDEGTAFVPVAIAYFSADDGKKIAIGQTVEVSPVNTEREEDGFIRGRVVQISDAPTSSEGMIRTLHNDQLVKAFSANLSAPFEVRIALDTQPDDPTRPVWSTRQPPAAAIEPGTLSNVIITIRSVRLITLIIPVVRRLLGIDLILSANETT